MKKALGGINALYPTPTVIVGAVVDGRPNFITIAHVGIVNHATPHLISISMGKVHHTNPGIREHREFSVNLPGENLVVETDYVGMVSGKKVDKSGIFELFYGELRHAPMIQACPVCMECRLFDTYDTPTHDLFIGEIVATHADEAVISEGKIDLAKVRPLLFDFSSVKYWSIGAPVAGCWSAGKQMKKR